MKKFIKRIFIFTLAFILLVLSIYFIQNKAVTFKFDHSIILKKNELLSRFIKDKNSINLILGSSMVEDSIIPDSLGGNWFSFTNSGQNAYETIKFIDYYKNIINIDTILCEIAPMAFRNELGRGNGNFHIFGEDSIIKKDKDIYLRNLQMFKNYYFYDFTIFFKKVVLRVDNSALMRKVWTNQGFSGRINNKPENLKNKYENDRITRHKEYFNLFGEKINYNYFNLLNSVIMSNSNHVIYVIPPKSKYYSLAMIKDGLNEKWIRILENLKVYNIKLWNYEKMKVDNSNFFWDESHCSYEGAKIFTNIIKNRLREN